VSAPDSRGLLIVAGLLAVVTGSLVLGLAVLGGVGQASATASSAAQLAAQTCVVSGPVGGLSPTQAADAEAVVSAAMAAGHEDTRVARIALMTAMTESTLVNLDHGGQGSLGLFQQRPSDGWGTPAQVMDPAYATAAFVNRLLAVPGWQSMSPWAAAEAVQRSAFANGSNYEAHWAAAGQVLGNILSDANIPGACGQGTGKLAGPASARGLPAGYSIPPGTPKLHAQVVNFSLEQLGKPYVWGTAGLAAFDCSGLTMAAWATVGVSLAHYTGNQQKEGRAVTPATLVPGDLVLVPGSDSPSPGIAGHVGIYLGDALVISAIDPQDGVAVQSWSTFVSGGLIALRDPAPGE
jgi:cell wall-associated NlpC family hydrolase